MGQPCCLHFLRRWARRGHPHIQVFGNLSFLVTAITGRELCAASSNVSRFSISQRATPATSRCATASFISASARLRCSEERLSAANSRLHSVEWECPNRNSKSGILLSVETMSFGVAAERRFQRRTGGNKLTFQEAQSGPYLRKLLLKRQRKPSTSRLISNIMFTRKSAGPASQCLSKRAWVSLPPLPSCSIRLPFFC